MPPKPSKKRSKPESSSSSVKASHYEDYLLFKPLVRKYRELCKLKILPTRYIKYPELAIYKTQSLLHNVGLDKLFDESLKVPYYPFLVYLFYANMSTSSSADGSLTISSSVKNVAIAFTANELAGILQIPTSDVELRSIELSDPSVNHQMFSPGCSYPMNNNSLNPIAKLIARIIAHNLIPKTGSFDHFASDKINAVYAIFAEIKVDWATIFINNMASKHTKFLPFGSFFTLIFQHFNVDLTNEPKVESTRDFFDKVSLSRMHISLDSTPSSHSRSRASTSSTSSTSEICDRLDRLETHGDGGGDDGGGGDVIVVMMLVEVMSDLSFVM
ncbi:uncharacterized protein LOC109831175 [Asparagus officinalis]|uniref:uncharacterized protein LOC109831175 n=1 Tax=Asparagus officinalis TaxID=4686 RepID=UPI00098E77CD|nr:uncharacterized protein LOC109831175 [Asparagus officinalis]